MEWNTQVDTALVSGVPREKIKRVKKTEITDKISESLNVGGYRPDSFADVVRNAVSVLARLVNKVIEAAKSAKDSKEKVVNKALSKPQDKVLDKAVNKAVKKEASSNEKDVANHSHFDKKWLPVERDYQNMMAEGKRAGDVIHSVRSDINRNKEIIRENNKIRDDKRAQGKKQDISL